MFDQIANNLPSDIRTYSELVIVHALHMCDRAQPIVLISHEFHVYNPSYPLMWTFCTTAISFHLCRPKMPTMFELFCLKMVARKSTSTLAIR